jgi:cell division protein FtsL
MKSQIVLIVLLASVVLVSGIGVVYTRHINQQLFVKLEKLQSERDNLEVEWELLQLEQSTLVTDFAVEEIAQRRLNMLTPDPEEVLYIMFNE